MASVAELENDEKRCPLCESTNVTRIKRINKFHCEDCDYLWN